MLTTTGPVGIYSQGAGHGGAGGWEGPGDRIKGGGRALPNWPNRARAEGRPDDHWALLAQQGCPSYPFLPSVPDMASVPPQYSSAL